jgi:hypothetical protein
MYLAPLPLRLRNPAKLPFVICHLPFVILNAFPLPAIDYRRHVACSRLHDLRSSAASPAAISITVIVAIPIASSRGADPNPVA